MRTTLIITLFFTISSCEAFKLTEMGKVGESCFNNDTCTGDLVCVDGICVELDHSDDSDQSDESEKSDESEVSDQSDQSEASDQSDQSEFPDEDSIEDLCNFGELCWKVVPTQQKRCFNETGSIQCPDSASPFYGQTGTYETTLPGRGFENIKIGEKYFVFDEITELLWYKTAQETVSFENAQAFCQALNNSGEGEKSNWRLPYIHELVSIINFDEYVDPMVDGFYFPFIKTQKYWTLTKLGYENYYYVDFSGSDQFYTKDADSDLLSAICVSSDHVYDSERKFKRFVETPVTVPLGTDIIVEDSLTGLQWQKVTDYTARLWKDALAYCESLSYAGKTDWRLPNVNELHSIATYELNPELQTDFPDLGSDFYWTSTTNANVIENAWVVEFKYGIIKPELAKDENINAIYTMCVRDGN